MIPRRHVSEIISSIRFLRNSLCITVIFFTLLWGSLFAQETQTTETEENGAPLAEMPLEELLKLKVKVPGAITKLTRPQIPASITVITAEDIGHTPFRNMYDLIETYVPGAIWMIHEEGPHPGIRGIIVDRNYKYLLLVNGRCLNNKGHFGAKSELEAWDLSDISRVEIVRGPGSVTYGPGAVGGVINIITKASGRTGFNAGCNYVSMYNAKQVTADYGFSNDKMKWYTHAGITATPGFMPNHYLVNRDYEFGRIGKDIFTDRIPMDYFADAYDQPQVKAHLELQVFDNWRFWTRYTQQGSTWRGNEVKKEYAGKMINMQVTQDRQFTSQLEYVKNLSESVKLHALLSVDTYDTERRTDNAADTADSDHPLNKRVDFSEDELLGRVVCNWHFSKDAELAAGLEYAFDRFRPPWRESERDMRLGDGGNMVNGPDSRAIRDGVKGSANYNGSPIYIGNGWNTHTFSLFSEANLKLFPLLTMLASARVDKNTYTQWLFSPRIALISPLAEKHVLKAIAQHSVRMNTASQLYADARNGGLSPAEQLQGIEGIYSFYPHEKVTTSAAVFYNQVEVLGFESDSNETKLVGNLRLAGMELECRYSDSTVSFGGSYSIVKQLSWKMASDVRFSGISYSDYREIIDDDSLIIIHGVGNDLNNWPNHAVKLYGCFYPKSWVSLHVDGRIMFGYQGARDGLTALENAVSGSEVESDVATVIDEVEADGVYSYDLRSNASITFHVKKWCELQLYVQNITTINGNRRYSYDEGNDDPAPRRVRFIEEPRVFGIKVTGSF